MENTKHRKIILLSGAIIILCLSIIVGVSSALFTDNKNVTNHLKAGDLSITLTRTKLTSTYLDEQGYLKTETDTTPRPFNGEVNHNVLIPADAIIVPMSEYEAEMLLENKDDVAFRYWIQIVTTEGTDALLASQIEVTVTVKNPDGSIKTEKAELLQNGIYVGSEDSALGVLAKNESTSFTVNVKFTDDRTTDGIDNNKAQGLDVYFDLVVWAVQYVEG